MAFAQAIQKQEKDQKVMDMVGDMMGGGARSAMNAEGRGPTVSAARAGIGQIDPSKMPQLSMLGDSGKAAAEMIVKMMTPHNTPEGSVSRDLFGNMLENPKLGEGQMASRGPSGAFNGASMTPGYLANLGQIEDVKEGTKARYRIENVPVAGMPGSTEPVSVLDFVRGREAIPGVQPTLPRAAPAGGMKPGEVVPIGLQQARDATRLQILNEELPQAQARVANATDPKELQAANENLSALQREMQGFKPRGATRRTQTPAEQTADVEKAKILAASQATAQVGLPQTIASASQAIQNIDEMIGSAGRKLSLGEKEKAPHPGFEDYVGATWKPWMRHVEGSDASGFESRHNQILGGAFLQAFESLKGGGQITEIEGSKATQAKNRMTKSASESEYIQAAREYQDILRKGVARAIAQAGGMAAGGAAPAAQSSVTAGMRRFNPALGVIE